jgi:hypothetical protein
VERCKELKRKGLNVPGLCSGRRGVLRYMMQKRRRRRRTPLKSEVSPESSRLRPEI